MSTESAKQNEATEAAEEEALLEDASASRPVDAEGDRASAAQPPTSEELQAGLAAARAEAESLRDQALRVRAEMENLRRRHAVELEKAHKYALDSFVRELLQVRDSLELGHDAALAEGADIAKLREGTELTLKLLGDVMDRFGVAPVDPIEQPFDPEFHQAMTMQPRSDLPPNTVVAVMQKGYTLNGRLVRPALVMVSQQAS
ncbi:nucleotide exchange factor GrpE [Thiocapsa sp.]|uniref:nucleotide exchange factor GrpE n=1 Tax=Thiocapsa sp. TaxID=2024551 RepID=UPI002C8CFF68|nr:nucleotide exchange factor GrpE [Thiocapsa sp.]HSO84512.1 nucleotide exchange factor GrpE [Thiocapsa sp.]